MTIRFLGTAAAEGIPAVFCNCALCVKVKSLKGKDLRTRSQLLVNENILIDLPPDTYFHKLNEGLDLSQIKHVLITHAHPDHLAPSELRLRTAPYAYNLQESLLHFYGSRVAIKRVKSVIGKHLIKSIQGVSLQRIKPYQTIALADISVTALPAVHTKGEDCFIFLLDEKSTGKTFLQFNDSGILPDSVYQYLKTKAIMLDAIAFDCTYGYFEKGAGRHMGALDADHERARMKNLGILNPDCQFILTHFSHNNGLLHDELQEKVRPLNFTVAWDGMELNI